MQHVSHDSQNLPSKPPPNDNETYRMMVLRLDQPEEDFDRGILQVALNLGINVPQSPRTTLDLITHDVSTFDINISTPEPSVQSSSQGSDFANAASDSSIDHHRHTKTPSLTTASITSAPSTSSASSRKSNYVKIKKNIRRISTLRRRKTLSGQAPDTPLPIPNIFLARPALQPRAVTADRIPPNSHLLQPHALTTNEPQMGSTRRRQIASASYVSLPYKTRPPLPPPTYLPPPPPREPHPTPEPQEQMSPISYRSSAEINASRRRSLSNPSLKKLRTIQLQEQLRFISFEASQNRLMRTAHLQAKRDALSSFKSRQSGLENTHAEALVSLEHRQLSAEVDLRKGLEVEKKACDTRLKHMQAYCNPKSNVQGMPRREVTKSDYQQLEQQYHLRNTMDTLHASRINVLREKQAKQLERVAAKQEAELERVEQEFEQKNIDLDYQFRAEEVALKDEFAARQRRLVRRWDLAEAIERKKLEIETGDDYAQLPAIEWSDREHDDDEDEHNNDDADNINTNGLRNGSGSGISSQGSTSRYGSSSSHASGAQNASHHEVDNGDDVGGAEVVYGAMNMNMI